MSEALRFLLVASATGVALLICVGLLIVARRWHVAGQDRRDALHARLIRSELMQAVARGEEGFLIEHWAKRDRTAALVIAAQILGFIKGPDRRRLEEIVERNGVLRQPLARLARLRESHRVAAVRQLAAFGNASVQGSLHALLQYDPSPRVRLEAAIAILVAGTLPSPWRIVRSVLPEGQRPTPNHRLLFRDLALNRVEAVIAMATLQERQVVRLLAIDALGFATDARAATVLRSVEHDADPMIAATARDAMSRLDTDSATARRNAYAAAAQVRRVAQERLAA
jgi:hypothetical protein